MNNQIERYSEDHAKRQVADAIIDRITDLKTLTRKQKCYTLNGHTLLRANQNEIADLLGTKQSEISKVKNHKLKGFTLAKLIEWASALGLKITVSYGVSIS